MRYYHHWIKIPFSYYDKGVKELEQYLKEYPDSAIYYYPHKNSFNTYVQLKTIQDYYDLDLKINMCYNQCLKYIKQKPKEIYFWKRVFGKEYDKKWKY